MDVFSFGIVLCEILARIPADPEILPRTQVELKKPIITSDCFQRENQTHSDLERGVMSIVGNIQYLLDTKAAMVVFNLLFCIENVKCMCRKLRKTANRHILEAETSECNFN